LILVSTKKSRRNSWTAMIAAGATKGTWPLAYNSKPDPDRVNASSKRDEQRAREGAKAIKDYRAAGAAVLEKTARLKSLRLAKEASEKAGEAKDAKTDEPVTSEIRSVPVD
jgi:hypothetical protein